MNCATRQQKPTGRVSNSEPPGMSSKIPASTVDETKSSVLQLNKTRALNCNSSRKSQIQQTHLCGTARHMKHKKTSTTQRKERPAALDCTNSKKRVPQQTPRKSRNASNVMAVKHRGLPSADVPRPKQDAKTPRLRNKNPPPSTTAASRRKTSIKRPVQSSESRTKAGKVQIKQNKNTTTTGPKQMSSSSLVRINNTPRGSSTGKKKQDTSVGFRKPSGPTSEEDKLMTPRLSIAVVVQPRSAPKGQPTEISLWKRIKTKSSVKIVSEWKTDEKLEIQNQEMSDKVQKEDPVLNRIEERSATPESKSSNTCTNIIDQPSSAKSSTVVQDEIVSMALPLSAKNDPFETPPLTSRSPMDSLEQREEEEDGNSAISSTSSSHSAKDSNSPTPPEGDNESSVQFQLPEYAESEFQEGSVSSHPNPPNLVPLDSCFANASVKTNGQELDPAIPRTPKCTQHTAQFSGPGNIIYNPMACMSPDLGPFSRPEKHTGSLSYGGLHPAQFSSFESNSDPSGMQSSRSSLRRVDSARIGAQCEFLRDTIKEESKRVRSMTSLLEAMNSAPGHPGGQNKTEVAQTQEINRRQAEKIHDLEMENQHLRQLLEFSIGSIRRESLTPSHRSDEEQRFGPAFNNPIPVLEQADKELVNTTTLKNKQTKPHSGKKSSAEKEQIYYLQQTLESKDVLLKVITESICQISSMHGYYQKRLEDLEKDRSRIQKERSEHLHELLHFGIDLRSQELDSHSQKAEIFRQIGNCGSAMGFADHNEDC